MIRSTRGALAILAALALALATVVLPAIAAPGTTVPTASADGATSWTCSASNQGTCTVSGAGTVFDLTWTTPIPWAPGGDCGGNAPQGCPAAVMRLQAPYTATYITTATCTGGTSVDNRYAGLNWNMYFYSPLATTTTCHLAGDLSLAGATAAGAQQFGIWNMTNDNEVVVNLFPVQAVTRVLTISSVTISPDAPSVSDDPITATVTVRNDTPDTITGVTAGLTSTTPQVVTAGGALAPPSVASLAPGASTNFTVDLHPVAAGDASLTVTASATDGGAALTATPRTRTFTVTPAALTVALAADPTTPHVGQATTITATVTNVTGRTVTGIASALTATPTSADLGAPAPASIASLAPGASASIRWSFTGHAATSYALSVATSWTDPVDGPKTATTPFSLPVANDAIVVNSTADSVLTTKATENHYCDVDDFTAGDQCTLRAAIQTATLLGADGSTIAIAFDVPGRTPTIAPASALPAITVKVAIDGTTQTGGWVRVSGASAGGVDGLALTGGGSSIRGLVLGGWRTAIALSGAGGDTIVGNRIGTDVSGKAADANVDGVLVQAPDVRIGALVADGAVCDGDCNVISGNTHDGITNGGAAMMPARLKVVGNLIGTDATGEAALVNGALAIDLNWSSADGRSGADAVQIGGSTARTGLAPGNVVVGGISSLAHTPHAGRWSFATVRVQGNLLGSDWQGARVLQPVKDGISLNGTDYELIGGATAAEGNAIVGASRYGVVAGAGIVDHNSIGVGLDGRALPNAIGIVSDGAVLCNNVISGNEVGSAKAELAGGNRIGTDATGTRAIPNRVGATGRLVTAVSARCPSTTWDVISGNTAAFGDMSTVILQRVLIGTDATGTAGLPNGSTAVSGEGGGAFLGLGGPESVESGSPIPCSTPCVIVAGNTGVGLDIDARFVQLQGVYVGIGLDGRALPNGAGPGIRLTGTVTPNHQGIVDTTVAHTTGPAIELDGAATADTPFQILRSTLFDAAEGVLLADGSQVQIANSTIHDVGVGVSVTGGASAPELSQNSMYNIRTSPYLYPATTVAIGMPTALTASLTGAVIAVEGDAPSVNVSSYRIDVYGEPECTATSAGLYPLGSFTVTPGMLELGLTMSGRVIVPSALRGSIGAVLVTATDTSNADVAHTGHYTRCMSLQYPTARMSTSTSTAAPDSRVAVTGSGFAPGEQVEISLHSTPVTLATVTADASGAVSATVTIPASTPAGLHHLVLTGLSSGVVLSSELTVTGTAAAATSVGALASTGTDASAPLAAGVALLALGAGALLLSERRRRRIRPRG